MFLGTHVPETNRSSVLAVPILQGFGQICANLFFEYFWIFLNIFEYFWIFLNIVNILEYFGTFWNILEYFGKIRKNQEKFGKIWNITVQNSHFCVQSLDLNHVKNIPSKWCQKLYDGVVSQFPTTSQVNGHKWVLMVRQVFNTSSRDPMTIFQNESLELLALDGQRLQTNRCNAVTFRQINRF